MDPRKFLFPIFALGADGQPQHLRGNAFPVTADGGLVTCRHVISFDEGTPLAVLDREQDQLKLIRTAAVPEGVPLNVIQRQLGHANLRVTSVYLQGIDSEEIINAVHARGAPMMPAGAGLPG